MIEIENQIENADESKSNVMKNEHTPVRDRKILVAKRRIKKPVKENDVLQHTDKGHIDVEVVTSEIEKLELQNNNKDLDDLIKSENQVENAATEDVSQTDVDDDLEVMEIENQVENGNDNLQDTETAAEGQVAKLKSFWENL